MNYLTFDTETMDADEKLIFDIGYAVHNEQGKILHKNNFLIKETFDNSNIMENAFYKCNIPIYLQMLKDGRITKISFKEMTEILQDIVKEYAVETMCAYHLLFDIHSFYDTTKFVLYGTRKPRDENGKVIPSNDKNPNSQSFFTFCKNFVNKDILKKTVNYMCIYGMTATKLLTQEEYIHLAVKNKWFTDKGNIQTGAECAYRFISNDYDFKESHTALDDVLIEVELFKKCQEMEGEYTDEIIYTPYRLVKKRYEEIYGKPV